MTPVTASVTIGFASNKEANSTFSAEVDSRDDGLNLGKTQFSPGDSVGILLYKGVDVTNVTSFATSGNLSQGATIAVEMVETISFANTDTFNSQYPVNAGTATITWWGPSPSVTMPAAGGTLFSTATKVIAVGELKYKTQAQTWTLSGVNVAYPSALVVFTGEAP